MTSRVAQLADDLLQPARRTGGIDLIRDYALPIPTTIIAEIIGIPAADRYRFHRWSAAIVAADSSAWRSLMAIPGIVSFMRGVDEP